MVVVVVFLSIGLHVLVLAASHTWNELPRRRLGMCNACLDDFFELGPDSVSRSSDKTIG